MSDTPIADMIEQMDAEGATLGMILVAVRHAERFAQRHAQRLPVVPDLSPGAIRSRRWREKNKQNQQRAEANDAASGGDKIAAGKRHAQRHAVTPHCDLSSSLKEETSEERKKEVDTRARGNRGTRLVAGTVIADADRAFARSEGMSDAWIDRAWAEFIDYWIGIPGQRGTKLNWSATWRNRVRQIAPKGKQHEATGNVIVAADRQLERLRALNERPGGIRDGTGPDHVRLLSKG